MSEHDEHDHPHAPITNGDEPAAAARARALEELLVEKGVIRREDVRHGIDWLVSRSPADGETVSASAGTPRCPSAARCRSTTAGRVTASSFSHVPLICPSTAAVSMVAGNGPCSPTVSGESPLPPGAAGSMLGSGNGAPLTRSKPSVVARWATARRVATV